MKEYFELIDLLTTGANASEVGLCLCDLSAGRIKSFEGQIRGPFCEYARTLPASYRVQPLTCEPNVSHYTSLLIPDPCYWTPELPFLYELNLEITLADGTQTEWAAKFGLPGLTLDRANLRLEGRRTVLRGCNSEALDVFNLAAARAAEVAVIVGRPDWELLQEASRLGVMLVADLRGSGSETRKHLAELAWQPCTSLAIVDDDCDMAGYQPNNIKLLQVVEATRVKVAKLSEWASVLAIELGDLGNPFPTQDGSAIADPSWIGTCGLPILAIQKLDSKVAISDVRQQCDQLQSSLAPEFDFAGYFVG